MGLNKEAATDVVKVRTRYNKQCGRRHGMQPPVCKPDLWPFDFETGVRVASKVGNLPSKFGHARPLGSGIIRYVRDGRTNRQTDRQTDNAYYPFPYYHWTKLLSDVAAFSSA